MAGVGLLSLVLALVLPLPAVGLAGFVYFLFGVLQGVHGWIAGARRRKLLTRRG